MNLSDFSSATVEVEFVGKRAPFRYNPLKCTTEVVSIETTIRDTLVALELAWDATETVDGKERPAPIERVLDCVPFAKAVWLAIQEDLFPSLSRPGESSSG